MQGLEGIRFELGCNEEEVKLVGGAAGGSSTASAKVSQRSLLLPPILST